MRCSLVYITASNHDEAMRLGRALVEARLVACANVSAPITSLYRWEGKVQEDQEVSLVAKTREDLLEAVIAKVKELHSYTCPCVVALPITSGNPAYLEWLARETEAPVGT